MWRLPLPPRARIIHGFAAEGVGTCGEREFDHNDGPFLEIGANRPLTPVVLLGFLLWLGGTDEAFGTLKGQKVTST